MSATTRPAVDSSPRALARAVGIFLLITIVLGVIAQGFISERLISFRDAAATAANIMANESLYRAGFTIYMLEMCAQITSVVLLYHLLKPVNGRIATLALAFGLVGCTIKIFSRVLYLAPLFVLGHSAVRGFTAEQLQSISLILLHINDRGAGVALSLFGFETVLEGWLIFRSAFLPRWLGAGIMISGAGWLTFLSPTLGGALFNLIAVVALLVTVAMIGWLLVKGVDEDRWRALAAMNRAN